METARRGKWKYAALFAVIVVLYWLVMFAATHRPYRTKPTNNPYPLDKLEHLSAFFILSVLLCSLGTIAGIKRRYVFTGVVLAIAVYGILDELSQSLVRGRDSDILDWLADLTGAVLGVIVFAAAQRFYIHRTRIAGESGIQRSDADVGR